MLKDIQLKDIYLGEKTAWLAGVPGTSDPIPAPPECATELTALWEYCKLQAMTSSREEFAVRSEGVTYRVSTLQSMEDTIYVLRRFPAEVPSLGSLGLPTQYVANLLTPNISGLVVISGAYGQGKTTTASAVIATRLRTHGGVAITIEEPPEMPLEGLHSGERVGDVKIEGVCYQTWVDQGGFGEACRKAARWAPSMIFLGEVRDSETAVEALRASINGRLIICTTHADSVPMAIERIYSLANGAAGNSDDTASLLANGLLCVLNQRLEGAPARLKVESLWLGGDASHGIRNTIRHRRFEQIGSEITLQLNRLLMAPRSGNVASGNDSDRRGVARS